MQTPLISVIVPVYKVEQYLDECVQSILGQTYCNLEIILVDDGSPDRCPEMCDEYARQDARIKVIHKQNGGLSSARNAGMEVMSGEYFGFVDSDDYIASDMYETLLRNFTEDVSIVGCMIYAKVGEKISQITPICTEKIAYRGRKFWEGYFSDDFWHVVWNKLYRTRDLGHLRFCVGRNVEDFLFTFHVAKTFIKKNLAMVLIPGFLYYYRQVPLSISKLPATPLRFSELRNLKEMSEDPEIAALGIKEQVTTRYYNTLLWTKDRFFFNKELMSQYTREFEPELQKIPFRFTKGWGEKHLLYYIVLKYLPFLWNWKFIRDFSAPY